MASAAQLAGQWVTFDADRTVACYRCIVPAPDAEPLGDCERHGVLGPIAGMIASMSALQTIEILGKMQPIAWGSASLFRRGVSRVEVYAFGARCKLSCLPSN